MSCFSFTNGPTYFGYAPGVNAANLTMQDIANANARLRPLLNATQGSTSRSARANWDDTMPNYSSWTSEELRKAIVERRIKSGKAAARM